MATLTNMRERTVAFYEVVAVRGGEQIRVSQLAWEKFLSDLALARLEKRKVEGESILVGATASVRNQDHLLLHRVKDDTEWLSVINLNTGEWSEVENSASQGFLDTSVVCFLEFGNIVAVMQGAVSAPTHKSLETWLNEIRPFPDYRLAVRPVLSRAEVERLQTASGASRIEVRIGSHKVAALKEKDGRLARFLRNTSAEYGDINVTMIISVPRGKAREEDRHKLLADLQDLADVMPEAADRAKATLTYAEVDGADRTRLVELVEHHITAKRKVPAVDDQGNSIRILSAVDAILGVAAEHEDELRIAVDSSDV